MLFRLFPSPHVCSDSLSTIIHSVLSNPLPQPPSRAPSPSLSQLPTPPTTLVGGWAASAGAASAGGASAGSAAAGSAPASGQGQGQHTPADSLGGSSGAAAAARPTRNGAASAGGGAGGAAAATGPHGGTPSTTAHHHAGASSGASAAAPHAPHTGPRPAVLPPLPPASSMLAPPLTILGLGLPHDVVQRCLSGSHVWGGSFDEEQRVSCFCVPCAMCACAKCPCAGVHSMLCYVAGVRSCAFHAWAWHICVHKHN